MASSPGWANLGSLIAGGNTLNSELAYDQGESLGAKTQDAIAQARQRVMQNNARANADKALEGVIPDPKARAAAVNAVQRGENPADIFNAIKTNQEIGFRGQIADPTTSDEQIARNRLALGHNAGVIAPVGTEGSYVNEVHPGLGVQVSNLGQQIGQGKVDESAATVRQKDSQTALNNLSVAGGGKAPSGFQWGRDENGNAKLVPMPGGPKDPDGPGAPLGSREASMLGRVLGGGKQSVAALKSILSAPTGANTGVFGIGSAPGHNLLNSTLDTLRNKASSDDTQAYNTMLPGLSRGLAAIETMGLVPGGTFTQSFDNLQFREGDTEATRLHKLADMRQVIENGLDVLVNNPRLPASQRKYAQDIVDEVRQTIPFTHADLFGMQKGETVADMVKRHQIPTSAGAAAPVAAQPGAIPAPAVPIGRNGKPDPGIPAGNPYQGTPADNNAPAVPKVGYTEGGYRFKGGDPSKQANWEKL